jgi:hypothetical protein
MTYEWNTWWGGTAKSDNPPMIAAAGAKVRAMIGGLQAKKQQNGPQFAVKSGKELMFKLRDALDKLGYDAPVVAATGGDVATEKGTCAFLTVTVELQCPDGSFKRMVGSGHGADRDDKAGGKASTYAWKDALVKGLSLPDAEMADTDDEAGVSPVRPPPGAKKADATFDPATGSADFKRLYSALDGLDAEGVKVLISDARGTLKGSELKAFADKAIPLLSK